MLLQRHPTGMPGHFLRIIRRPPPVHRRSVHDFQGPVALSPDCHVTGLCCIPTSLLVHARTRASVRNRSIDKTVHRRYYESARLRIYIIGTVHCLERPTGSETPIYLSELRRWVVAALLTFAAHRPTVKHWRCSEAIDTVIALCPGRDPRVDKVCRLTRARQPGRVTTADTGGTLKNEQKVDRHHSFVVCSPMQYVFCIGLKDPLLKHR